MICYLRCGCDLFLLFFFQETGFTQALEMPPSFLFHKDSFWYGRRSRPSLQALFLIMTSCILLLNSATLPSGDSLPQISEPVVDVQFSFYITLSCLSSFFIHDAYHIKDRWFYGVLPMVLFILGEPAALPLYIYLPSPFNSYIPN